MTGFSVRYSITPRQDYRKSINKFAVIYISAINSRQQNISRVIIMKITNIVDYSFLNK